MWGWDLLYAKSSCSARACRASSLASVGPLGSFSVVSFPFVSLRLSFYSRDQVFAHMFHQIKHVFSFQPCPLPQCCSGSHSPYPHVHSVVCLHGSVRPLPTQGLGTQCPSKGSASSPITAPLSYHLSQAPHPSLFNSFLCRFSVNRKQLLGWNSLLLFGPFYPGK